MLQSVIHILFHYTYITDSTNSEYLYAIDFTGIHFDVSRAWLAAEVKAGLRFISWLHTDIQSKDSWILCVTHRSMWRKWKSFSKKELCVNWTSHSATAGSRRSKPRTIKVWLWNTVSNSSEQCVPSARHLLIDFIRDSRLDLARVCQVEWPEKRSTIGCAYKESKLDQLLVCDTPQRCFTWT